MSLDLLQKVVRRELHARAMDGPRLHGGLRPCLHHRQGARGDLQGEEVGPRHLHAVDGLRRLHLPLLGLHVLLGQVALIDPVVICHSDKLRQGALF